LLSILSLDWRQRKARLPGEEWLAISGLLNVLFYHPEELSEDAADGPDIDGCAILLIEENNLRGAVPPGDHMPR